MIELDDITILIDTFHKLLDDILSKNAVVLNEMR